MSMRKGGAKTKIDSSIFTSKIFETMQPYTDESEKVFSKGLDSTVSGSASSTLAVEKVDIEKFKKIIVDFKEHAEGKEADLPKSMRSRLSGFKSAIALLQNDPVYPVITDYIKKVYSGYKINAGTVGAYFYGCLSGSDHEGNLACTPVCVNSVKPPKNLGFKDCEKTIASYKNGDVKILNNTKSIEVIIHSFESDFKGLNKDGISILKSTGAHKATVKKYSKDNISGEVIYQSVPIEQISYKYMSKDTIEGEVVVPPVSKRKHKREVDCDDNFNGIIFAIVILILFVGVIAVLYYNQSPSTGSYKSSQRFSIAPGIVV